MNRLTRDGTAEHVSRDQILRHARGQGNVHFPCSADREQDWQPYPVDPYFAICRYMSLYAQYNSAEVVSSDSCEDHFRCSGFCTVAESVSMRVSGEENSTIG